MRKTIYDRTLLLISGLSLLALAGTAAAQCVTPPTCSELGYTKSAADCSGHTFLKCPFNTAVGYCDLESSSTPVPTPDPTPTYKVGDSYSVNGAVIGKVIGVSSTAVKVASNPRAQSSPTYSGLEEYCQNLSLGGGDWYAPAESNCSSIQSVFKLNGVWDVLIVANKSCSNNCICYSSIQSASYTRYYSCIAGFQI